MGTLYLTKDARMYNGENIVSSISGAGKTVSVKSVSLVQLFATPWTLAYQASLSMGFPRQEHWSGVPLPSPTKGTSGQIKIIGKTAMAFYMNELAFVYQRPSA